MVAVTVVAWGCREILLGAGMRGDGADMRINRRSCSTSRRLQRDGNSHQRAVLMGQMTNQGDWPTSRYDPLPSEPRYPRWARVFGILLHAAQRTVAAANVKHSDARHPLEARQGLCTVSEHYALNFPILTPSKPPKYLQILNQNIRRNQRMHCASQLVSIIPTSR